MTDGRTSTGRQRSRPRPTGRGDGSWRRHRGDGRRVALCVSVLTFALAAPSPAAAADLNDYPTAARAEYVFACMQTNGQNQQVLNQCACSIDVVASILPYASYVTAETVLSVGQVAGPVGAEMRVTEASKIAVRDLRRAQAEAEVRCF